MANSSKVDMDPNYDLQLRSLREQAAAEAEAVLSGQPSQWMRPSGWAGDLDDWKAMEVPFASTTADQQFVDAVKDPTTSGVVGDVIAAATMIEYLSVMERAFRSRHAGGRIRNIIHAQARKAGQGSAEGSFTQIGLEYPRRIIKRAKGPVQ